MYQWLPIIFIALHSPHMASHSNGLPAKNRNHVTILDSKIGTMEARLSSYIRSLSRLLQGKSTL